MNEHLHNNEVVRVFVTAGARKERVSRAGRRYEIAVREKAEHGAANTRVRTLLALTLGVPEQSVILVRGNTTPTKHYRVLYSTA